MTLEAEGVELRIVLRIEISGILLVQEPEILEPMRVMAGTAVPELERTVLEGVLLEQLAHVRQLVSGRIGDVVPVVAAQAEVAGHLLEQMLDVGAMGIVTGKTLRLLRQSAMLDGGILGQLVDILVAAEAKLLDREMKKPSFRGIVRVMTIDAALGGRRVPELTTQDRGIILVTTKAQGVARLQHRPRVRRIRAGVAKAAIPRLERRMIHQRPGGHRQGLQIPGRNPRNIRGARLHGDRHQKHPREKNKGPNLTHPGA